MSAKWRSLDHESGADEWVERDGTERQSATSAFPTPLTHAAVGEVNDTDARLWHPWLRINRVLRVMRQTRCSGEAWLLW